MDFQELKNDGLMDKGSLSGAIPEAYLRKNRLLAPHTLLNEGPPRDFQILVANGHLEAPIATVETKFEVGDFTFGTFYKFDKPYKPFEWSSIPTTKQDNTRYASRNPKFSLLLNETWILDLPKYNWNHTKPSKNYTAIGWRSHILGKITD